MNNLAKEKDKISPLKVLKNISCFKKILKGFTPSNTDTLLDVLLYQPKLVHSCMTKGFTLEDANFFNLSCKVHYNIPLVASAWFGHEKGYTLQHTSENCSPVTNFERDQLLDFLQTIELPNQIKPIHLEIKQTVDNIESIFTFKVNPK